MIALAATVVLAASPAPAVKPFQPQRCRTRSCHRRVARKRLRRSPRRWALASWYGPGLYGNRTACGQTLQSWTRGVAHKTLPCGRRLRICFRRCTVTRVIDRGPYVGPREFDLTAATRYAIGFPNGVASIRVQGG